MYLEGTGIEDFEGCERVFSESNRVAAVTRHATPFHRHQLIGLFFSRWNEDKRAEISKLNITFNIVERLTIFTGRFILNNYRQALTNINSLNKDLQHAKQKLGIASDDVFAQWLTAEESYLKSLKKMPNGDMLAMEYVKLLKDLHEAR